MSSHDQAVQAKPATGKRTHPRRVSGGVKPNGESLNVHARRERTDAAREAADFPEQLAGVPFN